MILISYLQIYREDGTIEHVKALAFNRAASSTGETEALQYIEKELKDSNIKSEIEYFSWSGPMRILMRTSYVLILILFLLFRLFLIVIVYFIIKFMFEKTREISFVKKEESKNIFAQISAKERKPNRPLVIFSAHYDSISTNLPYKLQVVIFFIYRLIVYFYALIIILFSLIFILEYFDIVPLTYFTVLLITFTSVSGVFVSIPIIYLVFVERPSSGSIDNASGVAILIEMAKLIKRNPFENIDVLFLWFGAEEWGLKGSKSFCDKYYKILKQNYDLDKSLNINLDMVGTYIGLLNKSGIFRRKINKNFNDILEASANQLKISIRKHNKIISPKSDYISFKKFARKTRSKFQVSCFLSSKDSKYIHSLRDTPDKCSVENLNGCLNICYHALKSIDSNN
ncbi:MAG: M28 family peptidase [Promethearchaeota archaeon]|nr:MAG: M28 family peptidase [Candidatus Lokiarchaeota archaeon]